MQNFGGGEGANSSDGREQEQILYTNMNVCPAWPANKSQKDNTLRGCVTSRTHVPPFLCIPIFFFFLKFKKIMMA